ncbi:hypothetical protein L596_011824 [Steinernema carpocapsae]|uniref:Uncharacterized protein n=1 Tax=Steinernema carpocapsae TaxID=34508 RepID=A0A4U5NW23_STECR|nr:hypothetical protein L596_011824 [Steinernema carpocapsae]
MRRVNRQPRQGSGRRYYLDFVQYLILRLLFVFVANRLQAEDGLASPGMGEVSAARRRPALLQARSGSRRDSPDVAVVCGVRRSTECARVREEERVRVARFT